MTNEEAIRALAREHDEVAWLLEGCPLLGDEGSDIEDAHAARIDRKRRVERELPSLIAARRAKPAPLEKIDQPRSILRNWHSVRSTSLA
jgi:hypothetical protein